MLGFNYCTLLPIIVCLLKNLEWWREKDEIEQTIILNVEPCIGAVIAQLHGSFVARTVPEWNRFPAAAADAASTND